MEHFWLIHWSLYLYLYCGKFTFSYDFRIYLYYQFNCSLYPLYFRYREDPNYSVTKEELTDEYQNSTDEDELIDSKPSFISVLFNLDGYKVPNKQTTEISTMIIFALSKLITESQLID